MVITRTQPTFQLLSKFGIDGPHSGAYAGSWLPAKGPDLLVHSPATAELLGSVRLASGADYAAVRDAAHAAFLRWREVPAPQRGEYVRRIGEALRARKDDLGRLVSLEMGKILQEGLGEVQEAIDIADFAVGQSRQLYGLSMHSERPGHAMREQWHPLGLVGIISAFNFPAAVWAWNSMIALICGDACIWKPSPKAPLTAIAMTKVAAEVLEPDGFGALLSLVIGTNEDVGEKLVADPKVPLVSFTGSTAVGREVAAKVARRLGRTILELGGNNGLIVTPEADLSLAVPAIVFGSVGTAGQRCTTTRRLIVHRSIADDLERRLVAAYGQVRIGNPLAEGTLMGPLIDAAAVERMSQTLKAAKAEGGEVLCGAAPLTMQGAEAGGNFVRPAIVRATPNMKVVREETFAPILYVLRYDTLDEAIAMHNDVPQGLSSAIFSLNVREAERFLSASGSDCGIANVNIGTSGAEIGGAFGGEKDTGGGRESGSDSWKAYMRRQTNTVNWSTALPLAQGIRFDLG
ncbi:MAG: aldehyde dehydrogenase family protein [Planctomycetaceae bacterium]|nr:aldehyde dehydrogenase family protein [Planctomycetaceae bacterium]